MESFREFINEQVSEKQLKDVERFADRLFAALKIDVEFSKHFRKRVNDERNNPEIVLKELIDFFKRAFVKHGKHIQSFKEGTNAVLKDIQTDLNLPFVLKYDEKNGEMDLVAKTIMRNKDFRNREKSLRFA